MIRFADSMYKIKGMWYAKLHATKELLQFEKDVVALIAHDLLDDATAFMDEDDKARVQAFQKDYELGVEKSAAKFQAIYDKLISDVGTDPRLFAQAVNGSKFDSMTMNVLFSLKKGIEARAKVREIIAKAAHPTAGTQRRVDDVRHLFGGIFWQDYRPTVVETDE